MRLNFPARHLLMFIVYAVAALAPISLGVFILAMTLFRLDLFGARGVFGAVAEVTYLLSPLLGLVALVGIGLTVALGFNKSGPELSRKDITP